VPLMDQDFLKYRGYRQVHYHGCDSHF